MGCERAASAPPANKHEKDEPASVPKPIKQDAAILASASAASEKSRAMSTTGMICAALRATVIKMLSKAVLWLNNAMALALMPRLGMKCATI